MKPLAILTVLFMLVSTQLFAQITALPIMKSTPGQLLNFNSEDERKHAGLYDKVDASGIESLSKEEQALYSSREVENYYDVLSPGCSWYCSGGVDSLYASSSLQASAVAGYDAKNAHDLDYSTAWVEGSVGDGTGQFIEYLFPAHNPRITEIIIANGYVKSEKAWRENGRVKRLLMYIDNKPFAYLELEDSRTEQHFFFTPIGNERDHNASDYDAQRSFSIRFEISEVYRGEKYTDTAISEIYFNGIDVH